MKQELHFTDHRRKLHNNKYIYAVVSRRSKGLSIGINLNIDKICNFNCPYCQVDRNFRAGEKKEEKNREKNREKNVDVDLLFAELEHLFVLIQSGNLWNISPFDTAQKEFQRVNDIAFAGDGEPTTCPQFTEVVIGVGDLIKKYHLEIRYHLLTNATMFHTKHIQQALEIFCTVYQGEIWAKLDAGSASWFQKVDGTQFPFHKILENLTWVTKKYKKQVVLQCMFHRFGEEEPSPEEIDLWSDRIVSFLQNGGDIRLVQIYTIARKPSQEDVLPLDKEQLHVIGGILTSKLPTDATTKIEIY